MYGRSSKINSISTISTKRARPYEQQYGRGERIILEGAAEILGIPLQTLLAAASTPQSSSNSLNSFRTRTSSGNSSQGLLNETRGEDQQDNKALSVTPFELSSVESAERMRMMSANGGVNAFNSGDVAPWLQSSLEKDIPVDHPNQYLPTPTCSARNSSYMDSSDLDVDTFLDWANDPMVPAQSAGMDELTPISPLQQDFSSFLSEDVFGHIGQAQSTGPDLGHFVPMAPMIQDPNLLSVPCPIYPSPEVQAQTDSLSIQSPSGTKRKGRGPFKDAAQRQETRITRSIRACIRCRRQRIRVYEQYAIFFLK